MAPPPPVFIEVSEGILRDCLTIFIDFSTSYGEVSKKNFFMKIVKQSYVFNRKSALPVQASPFLGGLRSPGTSMGIY